MNHNTLTGNDAWASHGFLTTAERRPIRKVWDWEHGGSVWGGPQHQLNQMPHGELATFDLFALIFDPRHGAPEFPAASGTIVNDVAALRGWAALDAHKAYPIMYIPWQDRGVPTGLTFDWWREFTAHSKDSKVAISCLGGLGRTGTALAILAGMGHATPKSLEPAQFIWRDFAYEAIETSEQLSYIESVLGYPQKESWLEGFGKEIDPPAKPSKSAKDRRSGSRSRHV